MSAVRRRARIAVATVVLVLAGSGVLAAWTGSPARAAEDLAAQVVDADAYGATRAQVGIAVLDRETGQLAENPAAHVQMRSASVVKVFVAENLLDRARGGSISLNANDRALLESMVMGSDDAAMSSLYSRYGSVSIVADVARKYGLTEVGPPPTAGYWGMFQITAHDVVRFYEGMLGGGLAPVDRDYLVDLMRRATINGADGFYQFYGISDALPGEVRGIKQGWMCCQEGMRRLHSTGLVGPTNRFAVAVLSQYGQQLSYAYGGETLTGVVARLFPGNVAPPPGSSRNPKAALDAVQELGPGSFRLVGWTYDPDQPTTALEVHAYVDGQGAAISRADGPRPDVGAAFPSAGSTHGYAVDVRVGPGPHQVCLYALNVAAGSGNTAVGCRTVVGQFSPIGALDAVRVSGLRTISVVGWALDREVATQSVDVHLYVGSAGVPARADSSRADIAGAFAGAGPLHGYDVALTRASGGPTTLCAHAINVPGTPGNNSLLGCRTVVLPTDTLGSLDGVTGGAGTLTARGWAVDAQRPGDRVAVHLYMDGRPAAAVTADQTRGDLAAAMPEAGAAHAFEATVGAAPGSHTVCAYAVPLPGSSSTGSLLRCAGVIVG